MAATRGSSGKRFFWRKTTFSRLSLGSEAVRAADRSCHGLMSATLARAVAIFYSRKKAQKVTDYRATAPLNDRASAFLVAHVSYTFSGFSFLGETPCLLWSWKFQLVKTLMDAKLTLFRATLQEEIEEKLYSELLKWISLIFFKQNFELWLVRKAMVKRYGKVWKIIWRCALLPKIKKRRKTFGIQTVSTSSICWGLLGIFGRHMCPVTHGQYATGYA